jgi:phospholipase C
VVTAAAVAQRPCSLAAMPLLRRAPSRSRSVREGSCTASLAVIATTALVCLGAASSAAAVPSEGIHNIKHVVMIMQENRSFDSYFGTYPGANGIPAGVCVPDPTSGACVRPFHNPNDKNFGGPHGSKAAAADIDGGKMDGFVAQADGRSGCTETGGCSKCPAEIDCADEVMGYHDAREIPNYWTYAQSFVLQDNMFESAASWSLPEHLYTVSGWSARCPKEDTNPLDCVGSLIPITPSRSWSEPIEKPPRATYAWTDVTDLLARAGVSWRYYVSEGLEPDCEDDEAVVCKPVKQNSKTPGIWNPLPDFTDVQQNGQVGNVQSLNSFYTAAHEQASCVLPSVSWIAPSLTVSEHPPSLISKGQAYVTTLINTIMRSPCWGSTAIFVSWDDWGGFYDHVVPPTVDENGYGLRVPGLVISPYAKSGYIDHQQLSHDAYLKFIEDDFLGSARLNPATDGRPDPRTSVREEAPGLGDLANDFDFSQAPRPPLLLSAHPEPGPASKPPDAPAPIVVTGAASSVRQATATLNATVNPNGGEVSDCHFEYGTTPTYGSSVPCTALPGSGSVAVEVSASATGLTANGEYHFRIVAKNAAGTSFGADRTLTTLPDAPAVQTAAAAPIAQTTGTVNATVNPNGGGVSDCHFEYGTTLAYGSSAPCTPSPGAGSSAVPVSAALRRLQEGTGYHVRVVATNLGGTSVSGDETFTTHHEELPEGGACQLAPVEAANARHGRYTTPACTTKSSTESGEYEWTPTLTNVGFTSTNAGASLETVGGARITCTAGAGRGQYTGPKTQTVSFSFSGCTNAALASCQSAGAESGEIALNALVGELGFIRDQLTEGKVQVTVGVAFKPEQQPYAASFECGGTIGQPGAAALIKGAVIAPLTPLEKMSTSGALKFAASSGLQRPKSFEGGATDVLFASFAGGAFERAGLTASNTLANGEPLEIKATP